ncbi:Ig-like domain repeat protein [Georgenia yuyongxinii]
MTFISDQVDVTIVDRLGRYKSRTITGVSLVSPAVTLEVEPIGRPVVVEVRGVATEDRKNLSFRVEQMPPGASAARIAIRTVGENTTLVWHDDLAQPYANPASYESGTHIRPGTYWITPVLAGYQAVAQKVDVPTLDGPLTESTVPFEITLDLSKYASLSIEVVRAGSCTSKDGVVESGTCKAVNDPVVTVTGAGQGDITAAAITGTNRVNFGLLPSGTYQVYVQAAGHRFGWYPVKLEAAQTAPEIVAVDQLGTLTGTVRSEVGAQALAGVQVEARLGAGEPFTAVTDSTGTYWITGTTSRMGLEPAGSGQGDQGDDDWTVTASAPGYTATGPSVVDVIPGSVTRDLILSPLPVDLFIDVYDPDRDPAAGTLIDGLDVVLMQGAANWKGADLTDTTLPGRYHFTDVLPGVYTVSVSGGGYAPLIASITVPATGEAAFVSLSIASRRNTVTGTVLGQTGGSAAAPLGGATVTLTALDTGDTGDTGDTLPKFTPVFPTPSVGETGKVPGQFAFYNVPDGDYTLTAAHEDYGGATNAATRAVRVQGGQIFSVDIVLYETARQVEVNVKSLNYFDLTGILVRLVPPAGSTEAPLAPQPAVRSADDPHVYTTVFNQVPPGTEWTAIASGPWGHFGTHKGKVDTGTATVSVDEMRVRVSATGAGSPPPLKVTVREGDATGPLVADVFVGVNAGTESIYLPAGTYSLVATATDGSTLQQSEITVTDDRGNDVSAAFVLTSTSDAATTTTLTAGASTVSAGGTLTLTADVAADSTVTTGSVTFLRNRVPIVATGNPATVTDGSAALAVTGLDAGVHGFTAQYSGGTGVQPSVSGSVFVVVSAPGASATNIVVGTTVRGSAVDFSLTSNTGVAGTIRLHVSGAASFVKDYTTSGEAVTDTWMAPMPGAYTAYAELSPTDTAAHAPSRSDVHSFTILPPPVATKTPTTTTVAISPDPAETSPVTLTATVSPAPGGGTVTFTSTSGSTTATVASGVEVNESGQATVTLAASTWAAANYTIRATFNGSATHAISSGTNTFKKK